MLKNLTFSWRNIFLTCNPALFTDLSGIMLQELCWLYVFTRGNIIETTSTADVWGSWEKKKRKNKGFLVQKRTWFCILFWFRYYILYIIDSEFDYWVNSCLIFSLLSQRCSNPSQRCTADNWKMFIIYYLCIMLIWPGRDQLPAGNFLSSQRFCRWITFLWIEAFLVLVLCHSLLRV